MYSYLGDAYIVVPVALAAQALLLWNKRWPPTAWSLTHPRPWFGSQLARRGCHASCAPAAW
eukprot:2058939-Pyramimonas_sp.AAC.1